MATPFPHSDTNQLFVQAEQAGLKLAIKGRIIAIVLMGLWLTLSRGPDRVLDFVLILTVFTALGLLHYWIIGSKYDKRLVKYVFLSIDILALTGLVLFAPPTPEVVLPQFYTFKFDVFPFYFVLLAIAAFSFSPGMVLWAGGTGTVSWLGSFAWVTRGQPHLLDWSDIPENATTEQFLSVILNENFVGAGSRLQEAIIFLVVAILIAIVMQRARTTVRSQLAAEQTSLAISQIFGRFVPESVASSMIEDQGALDPIEREATVLFTDIAGFTSLTESMGPSKTVEILNAYFDTATEIIGKHHGVVTQFQGDAILAIFNVPVEDPAHANRAVTAAKELLAAVETDTFAGENLAIRVGVNTGPLVAGNVGGGGRQSYTVHGDAVNLAARLEALNKEKNTRLLIAASTVAKLENHDLVEAGTVPIRGLSEPISIYTLPS